MSLAPHVSIVAAATARSGAYAGAFVSVAREPTRRSHGAAAHLLDAILTQGPLGVAFLAAALVATGALGYVFARSIRQTINTEAFLSFLRRLVQAGNTTRALMLSHVHDGPVSRLARCGLAEGLAHVAEPRADAGYRDEAMRHADPSQRARLAMEAALPSLRSASLRGVLFARLCAGATCTLGALLTSGVLSRASATLALDGPRVTGVVSLVLGLAALYTVYLERTLERDLARTLETVAALCNEPAVREPSL